MSDILLEAVDIYKNYQTPGGALEILKGVNFSLTKGSLSYILGRSGSGKSTFLNILGGLDFPTTGEIFYKSENISNYSEKKLAKFRNTDISFVFQFYHLLPELTLFENVLLPSLILNRPNRKWAKECLRRVKLYSRAEHYPSELSGGEKQRAAIARALVNRPAMVLCDEPTGNLDVESASAVMDLIRNLNQKEGQSFVIVTHDISLVRDGDKVQQLIEGAFQNNNSEAGKFS
jgi:lipoprotein-releasing system ATP-binding protein